MLAACCRFTRFTVWSVDISGILHLGPAVCDALALALALALSHVSIWLACSSFSAEDSLGGGGLAEGERKEKEGKEGDEKRDKEASDLLPHLVAPLSNHSALSIGSAGGATLLFQ